MHSEKLFTLEQIHEMMPKGKRDNLEIIGEHSEFVAMRKVATDYAGSWIVRAFEKVDDHYKEINVKLALDKMSSFLLEKVNKKRLIEEVLVKLDVSSFLDLSKRIEKKPKVTIGVQKGSCFYVYVRGKQGQPFPLRLTE